MDISVQTGQTKKATGVVLFAHTLTSNQGEHICLLLQIHADAADAKKLEKEARSVVEEALVETDGDAGSRLDSTLKELNGLFKGLLLSRSIDDVHAIAAVVDPSGGLHISSAGRAEAYVIRAGVASQITEFARGKPAPAFVHITSGELEGRDTIVFSTQRLLRTVTPAQMAQMASRGDQLVDELVVALESEKENAALAVFHAIGPEPKGAAIASKSRRRGSKKAPSLLTNMPSFSLGRLSDSMSAIKDKVGSSKLTSTARGTMDTFAADLKDPQRKRRAHLLLLAGALAVFLIIWAGMHLTTSTQRSQTRGELEQLVEQITDEIQTAENRHLTGDITSANAILERAELRAKQVMDNESGLFRMEALDLLERIRAKREQINNIVRLSPRTVVSLTSKNPDINAQGFIGQGDGEFVVYDKQDLYRVILNTIDDADRLSDDELILEGVDFPRYQTMIFQTKDSSVIELINGQPTSMKTEDPAGWITGTDMQTYLRFLYVLSPENNQIYKYERLSNRYSAPAQYNVNGDLAGGLDLAIDGNVYVLKEGGKVVKLFRGESQPFNIRYAPEDALKDATDMFKRPDGNFYFLDPVSARIVIASTAGPGGEASYVKQYFLEDEKIGELKDIYVDEEETKIYVLDEKRVYVVDLDAN